MKSKSYPNLKLIVDPAVDIKHGPTFVFNSIKNGRRNFLPRFLPYLLHYVISEKISNAKRNKIISDYGRYCYKAHTSEIKSGTKTVVADWDKMKNKYFCLVDLIFKKHHWPKGYYVGFATIWHSYPRNVKNMTFYFPYSHSLPQYANKVISHEMLHFMFFDYIKSRYGLAEGAKIKGKDVNYVWKVSEAFNNVIEEWAPYKKIFKHPARPYKETLDIFNKMSRQWKQKQDIDWLLDQWFAKK